MSWTRSSDLKKIVPKRKYIEFQFDISYYGQSKIGNMSVVAGDQEAGARLIINKYKQKIYIFVSQTMYICITDLLLHLISAVYTFVQFINSFLLLCIELLLSDAFSVYTKHSILQLIVTTKINNCNYLKWLIPVRPK